MISPYVAPAIQDPEFMKLYGKDNIQFIITSAVCQSYGVAYDQINVKSRKRELVEPRQVIMTLLNTVARYSLANAGFLFGKDHATVLHAKKTISNFIDTDEEFREKIKEILHEIGLEESEVDRTIRMLK